MGSLEVRVPSYSTTIPDSARVQREHEAARKTQQAWNSRQTWRRHTLDNIPFGNFKERKFSMWTCDTPERYPDLRPQAISSWLGANPSNEPPKKRQKLSSTDRDQALRDFPHEKHKVKSRPAAALVTNNPSHDVSHVHVQRHASPRQKEQNQQQEEVGDQSFLYERFLFYATAPPHRLVADAPEHGPMEQRVKPARIQSSLCPQPEQQQHLDLLTSGYWVIPVSPGLPAVTWAHLHADFVPTASLPSRPRTLVWTPTRLWTLWNRLEMAFKNFGGAILDAHFFEDGSEEMRLYSSGARALLWRGLLNTLHPGQRIQDPEERWFRGCGLVWRTLDGKKVMIA